MKKPTNYQAAITQSRHQVLRTVAEPFLIGLLKRTFIRIFVLPMYAFLAAPWLFIMLLTTEADGAIQKTLFKIVAILSGQPNATTIDEGGLARAVFVLFLLISTVIEVYRYFSDKKQGSTHAGISNKRRLLIQAAISFTGWVVVAFLFYGEMGLMGSLIALLFALFTPLLFVPEYMFREMLTRLRPNL